MMAFVPLLAASMPPFSPRHDMTVAPRCESTFENLVPPDDAATALREVFARVSDHIALQTLLGRVSALGFQMVFPNEGLTLGTFLPTVLGAFVSPRCVHRWRGRF